MMNHAAINMAGQAAIAHRTAAPLTAIPAGIATGMRAQLVTGHPMAVQVATAIVMTGPAMTGHAKTVPTVTVRKAIVRLMAIPVLTVTGTPAQRVVGLSMVGPAVIVSAMTVSRNGVAMACRLKLKAVIPTRTAPRMAAHHGVRRKRAAPGLAAVAIWTRAHKHPFALKPGPKIAHNNVVLAIMRTLVDSAQAVNSHLSQAAKRLTVMAAMRRCAGKVRHLLARSQAAKLPIQMVLPGVLPASLSAKPRRRKQPLLSLRVRRDADLTSSAQLANAFASI
jgi:hypothetical protein